MVTSRSEDGLFNAEELRLLASVRRSKVWRLLEEALIKEREDIQTRTPGMDLGSLAYTRGQQDEVTRLLHEGPMLVVYYQRSMRDEQQAKNAPTQQANEAPALWGGPAFDVEE